MLSRFSQGFKRYLANTSWLLAEKVLSLLVTLVVGVYVAKYLGAEQFGLLSFALSLVGLFGVVATLGLDEIVIRRLVQAPAERDVLLGTAAGLKLAGAVTLFLLVWLALGFTSTDPFTRMMVLIIAGGMIFQSCQVIDFYFQSQVKAKLPALAQSFVLLTAAAVRVALMAGQASLVWFVWVIPLENALQALALGVFYRRQPASVWQWRFNSRVALSLLRESWPLILAGFAVTLYMRIDQVMIKEMLDTAAVGNYAVAVRLSEAWYFIPMAISSSLFPAVIQARSVSRELYHQRLQKLYTLMTWLAIGIAVPMTFLAERIIQLLFGTEFAGAAGVLKIYIWAGVFVFLGVASGKHLLIEGLNQISFVRTGIGCILNIVLNIILIPKWGIQGAAWATLVSYGAANFSLIVHPRARHCFTMMLRAFLPWKILGKAAP